MVFRAGFSIFRFTLFSPLRKTCFYEKNKSQPGGLNEYGCLVMLSFIGGAENLLDGNDSTGVAFRHSWDTEQVPQRKGLLFTPITRLVRGNFLCPCSSSVGRFFTYLPRGTLGRGGPARQHIFPGTIHLNVAICLPLFIHI